jgi:hypothetical protein
MKELTRLRHEKNLTHFHKLIFLANCSFYNFLSLTLKKMKDFSGYKQQPKRLLISLVF